MGMLLDRVLPKKPPSLPPTHTWHSAGTSMLPFLPPIGICGVPGRQLPSKQFGCAPSADVPRSSPSLSFFSDLLVLL